MNRHPPNLLDADERKIRHRLLTARTLTAASAAILIWVFWLSDGGDRLDIGGLHVGFFSAHPLFFLSVALSLAAAPLHAWTQYGSKPGPGLLVAVIAAGAACWFSFYAVMFLAGFTIMLALQIGLNFPWLAFGAAPVVYTVAVGTAPMGAAAGAIIVAKAFRGSLTPP